MNENVAEKLVDPELEEQSDYIVNGVQYLTFVLGNESYGVDILAVKEIRGWDEATVVPNAPNYVKGVINLRGAIVPIIDLRIRFDVGKISYLPTTVVVILSGESDSGEARTMGFIVDAVSDVLDVEDSDLKSAPDFDGSVPTKYVKGLVNTNESVVTMLDIVHLLSMDN